MIKNKEKDELIKAKYFKRKLEEFSEYKNFWKNTYYLAFIFEEYPPKEEYLPIKYKKNFESKKN